MTKKVKVVGLDPSLNNWGIAHADLDIYTLEVAISHFQLIETESGGAKTVRKNSDDIRRAAELYGGLMLATTGATAAFCEVPVGSQSARAMASYGICVGVLGACPVPLIQVTPNEVKLAAVGHKQAAKEEMIEWATKLYPNAPWLRRGGKLVAKNEHLADAVASIYAGMQTAEFKTVLSMLRATHPLAA